MSAKLNNELQDRITATTSSTILPALDQAIAEAENNLTLLRSYRSAAINLVHGNNGTMSDVLRQAGPPLDKEKVK